jgi:copper(I)-binding protein
MTHRIPRSFLLRFALTAIGLLVLQAGAMAQMDHGAQAAASADATFKRGDLTVTSPWTRATPGGAKIAGGYLKITNHGSSADRFVGAKSDASDHVEIHEMSMSDSVMKMRPLPNGLEIKPGDTVELKPAGNHLMFVDLKRPLKQGDSLHATLQFENAGSLDVIFAVNALGANAPGH